jgi:hypothetical protein
MQNKKKPRSQSALTENHTRHKLDKLDQKNKIVAERAEHRKPRNFLKYRIHTRHPKKTNLTIILLIART